MPEKFLGSTSQMFSQLRQIFTFLWNFQNWGVVPMWTQINVSFFLRTANEILSAPVILQRQYTFQKMSPQTLGMKAETTRVSHRNVVCFVGVCFSSLVPAVECLSLSVWSSVCADTRRLFFLFLFFMAGSLDFLWAQCKIRFWEAGPKSMNRNINSAYTRAMRKPEASSAHELRTDSTVREERNPDSCG